MSKIFIYIDKLHYVKVPLEYGFYEDFFPLYCSFTLSIAQDDIIKSAYLHTAPISVS